MKRPELLTIIAIGGVGAGGQAYLLAHTLDSNPLASVAYCFVFFLNE